MFQLRGVAESRTVSTHSTSHEISTSAPPGGLGSELMDDFFIISQYVQHSHVVVRNEVHVFVTGIKF